MTKKIYNENEKNQYLDPLWRVLTSRNSGRYNFTDGLVFPCMIGKFSAQKGTGSKNRVCSFFGAFSARIEMTRRVERPGE